MNKLIIFILSTTLFFPLSGFAKEPITWLTIHWPPLMELDSSRQHIIGGQRGVQLKLLQADLQGYDHINREMTWNRFWALVKKEENLCNCMALKTPERQKIAEFSIPIGLVLPNQIIMRKTTAAELGFPETLSLVNLMQAPRLTGVLIKNRSYSRDIDRLLEQFETKSNISRIIIDEQTSLKMLEKKRMDYILEYPFVLRNTVQKDQPGLNGKFIAVPIREIAPFYFTYVACPKNEWGKAVIGRINDSLKRIRGTNPFRDALKLSYGGDNLKNILELYDRHLLGVQ